MQRDPSVLFDLARAIDAESVEAALPSLREGTGLEESQLALAVLAAAAYPAALPALLSDPLALEPCFSAYAHETHDRERYLATLCALASSDVDAMAVVLRQFTRRHRLRIALRELLPQAWGGAAFEVTARELSDLAAATVQVALDAAVAAVTARFGPPLRADGQASTLAVIGMGKLAGDELNAGSDVDLVFLYDTDDGQAGADPSEAVALHEYWSRVVRRLVSLLDDVTSDGFVWRVDLRLRPEGSQGAVVNSMGAMLRYYETWGRQWERAAWIRSKPVAGDLDLGRRFLEELEPFVFRRGVDPRIADAMIALVEQARAELCSDPSRDLKLGPGGIRALESFVQALQLIWGGKHEQLRVRGTLHALGRLRSAGLVTEREAIDLDAAYVLLRRAEHAIQNASGLQTHSLPDDRHALSRLSRCLDCRDVPDLEDRLHQARARVQSCFIALSPTASPPARWDRLVAAIERGSVDDVLTGLQDRIGDIASRELAEHLVSLAARPDGLLGPLTRDRHAGHPHALLDALLDSADPEQSARHLRAFCSHASLASVYPTLLAEHPRAARRFVTALGASAFLGELVARRPNLGDGVLFSHGMPSEDGVGAAIERELASLPPGDRTDPELVAGVLRRAKLRATLEIAMADVSDEVDLTHTTRVLSALADASIEQALRAAVAGTGGVEGFCVLALGKLGGYELGYGSDLDVIFVFDPDHPTVNDDAITTRARQAQRTIRILSGPHEEGPGYELDARLRPSGNQGVLVTSLPSFAAYHGLDLHGVHRSGAKSATWERQVLVRARPCAGDRALGERVLGLAHRAAYESGEPDPAEVHRLRVRLERELGRERNGRFDLKLGRGGLLDVEFAVQVLQMRWGHHPEVRVTGTRDAIDALESCLALSRDDAAALREAHGFLRKLEQRLHVVHATSIHLIEADAPGLAPLARRMGFRDGPGSPGTRQLLREYERITAKARETYLRILGV